MDKKLLNQTLSELFGDGSGGESITKLGGDINNKSIQDLELSKMRVGPVTICDKPNFDVTS